MADEEERDAAAAPTGRGQLRTGGLRRLTLCLSQPTEVSGTSRAGRDELESLLQFIREGDTLVVTRLDRLGRSLVDLADIVRLLDSKQAHLKIIDQH
ncbi:MAG: hypothetical protein GKR94_20615 [Gammaproteobacteria bacterium]|nr:hypothetical protein [Gammaproteobacteria bacterium]